MTTSETPRSDTLDLGELQIDEFALWFSAYPRHRDRQRAAASFVRARRVASLDEIMAATRAYAASVEGKPAKDILWPVRFLRDEPWRLPVPPVTPRQAARPRRRSSKPRRAPHRTSRLRDAESPRERWCRRHGITVEEYEARKGDKEWLERIQRRGIA